MGLVMRLSVLCWSFLEFQVVSIHQTDAQLMERGIYGLGGFLKVAKDPERPGRSDHGLGPVPGLAGP